MTNRVFWLSFWTVVGITAIAITAVNVNNSIRGYEAMTAMVANGMDPISARCAIKGPDNEDDRVTCMLRAALSNRR